MAEPDDIARQLELVASKYAASAYRDGLRPAQWQALRFFATASPDERNVTDFARWRGTTNGSTSILVSKLVERGYLARGDSHSNRNVDLRITDKARRALRNDPFEDLKAATEQMPSTQRKSVQEALDIVLQHLPGS
jgi:DNA-binding MarR family transcriptional regulator